MHVLSKNNIISKLKELKPFLENENVKLFGFFGSYARDEAREDSDIDILVETTPRFLKVNRGFSAFAKLEELKEILKSTFGKNIDIVDKRGLIEHKNTYILEKTVYV